MLESKGISVVAAVSLPNGVIGHKNSLPWRLRGDMEFFKKVTSGEKKAVIMGRRTFESIGRPLKGRVNIVLSRQNTENVISKKTLREAVEYCRENNLHPVIIGGASVYAEALKSYDCTLFLTVIFKEYDGDTFFPMDLAGAKQKIKNITKEVGECSDWREEGESKGYRVLETEQSHLGVKDKSDFLSGQGIIHVVEEGGVHYAFYKGFYKE